MPIGLLRTWQHSCDSRLWSSLNSSWIMWAMDDAFLPSLKWVLKYYSLRTRETCDAIDPHPQLRGSGKRRRERLDSSINYPHNSFLLVSPTLFKNAFTLRTIVASSNIFLGFGVAADFFLLFTVVVDWAVRCELFTLVPEWCC